MNGEDPSPEKIEKRTIVRFRMEISHDGKN
jgi:hypothetical protein